MGSRWHYILNTPKSIAPLVVFRIGFGLLVLFSTIRFWAKGWIDTFYIQPDFHFTYYGFSWVKTLGDPGMYVLFSVLILASLGIILGAFYRFSAIVFFLGFTYVELIDKSTYLNHYYFVSLIAFLMIFLPAHRSFSFDVRRRRDLELVQVPAWTINTLIAQISIVYIYAGLAKINYDWLFMAEPLTTWLMPKYDTWLIGDMFRYKVTAYFFAWFGMLYDCTIPFLLMYKKTRKWAYIAVIAFHIMTWWLFPIGIFPFVMIFSALIFFPAESFERFLSWLKKTLRYKQSEPTVQSASSSMSKFIKTGLTLFFIIQIAAPWRYLMYPGNLFWNEEGFRFSWRVMLVEKSGYAQFYVKHPDYPGLKPIDNSRYLSAHQEKQMSFQPDMILQYADHLKSELTGSSWQDGDQIIVLDNPEIYAEVKVKMNHRPSKELVNKSVELSNLKYDLGHRTWLTPFSE